MLIILPLASASSSPHDLYKVVLVETTPLNRKRRFLIEYSEKMIYVTLNASIGLVLAAVILYKAIGLSKWVTAAKATGLPYVIVPALETEIWGYLLTPILRRIYRDHLLKGDGWPHWCRFIIKDWAWEDKRRAHDEYGDVFLVVSPVGIICYSADAAMGYDVMNRRNEFTKPRDKYSKQKLCCLIDFADGFLTKIRLRAVGTLRPKRGDCRRENLPLPRPHHSATVQRWLRCEQSGLGRDHLPNQVAPKVLVGEGITQPATRY